ncbi:MAG TPA: hypothetical protein PLX69_21555, partial [Leptospiraceae bacterium]|nr:hypothetical protein [Leptospiraceae bacterium]
MIEDINNMDAIIQGLQEIERSSIVVGVSEKGGKDIQVIASANEFGAEIHSKKAMKRLFAMMREAGVKPIKSGASKGFIKIPERSFLRATADDPEVQAKLLETFRLALNQFLSGTNTAREVWTRTGQMMKRAIQSRITINLPPKNHPLTVRLKGHDQTLKGKTNNLAKSIDYEV